MTVAWVAYGLGWVLMLRLFGNDFYHSPDMPGGTKAQGKFWASLGPAGLAATFWPVVLGCSFAYSVAKAVGARMKLGRGTAARVAFGRTAWWDDADPKKLKLKRGD